MNAQHQDPAERPAAANDSVDGEAATGPGPATDRVAELAAAVSALKDQYLRAVAEAENIRRRGERERQDVAKYAATNLARDMLSVADNLARALSAIPADIRAAQTLKPVVTGIEMFHKLLDSAQAGDNAGLLLRGLKREDVERGQVIVKPGTTTPHTEFEGQAYILSKDEGGRHTPFFNSYRPQFYFRTTDVTGIVKLPEGVEMVMPGDNVSIDVELIVPIAMEEKLRFAIREGAVSYTHLTLPTIYPV